MIEIKTRIRIQDVLILPPFLPLQAAWILFVFSSRKLHGFHSSLSSYFIPFASFFPITSIPFTPKMIQFAKNKSPFSLNTSRALCKYVNKKSSLTGCSLKVRLTQGVGVVGSFFIAYIHNLLSFSKEITFCSGLLVFSSVLSFHKIYIHVVFFRECQRMRWNSSFSLSIYQSIDRIYTTRVCAGRS